MWNLLRGNVGLNWGMITVLVVLIQQQLVTHLFTLILTKREWYDCFAVLPLPWWPSVFSFFVVFIYLCGSEPDEGCFLNQVNTLKFRVSKYLFYKETHKRHRISGITITTMEPDITKWQRQLILSENNFSNHKNPVSSCTTHKLLSVLLHFTENPFEDHKP